MSTRPDAWRYQRLKPQLMRRHRRRCGYCRRTLSSREATVDHVTPYRDGGTADLANLRLSCRPCNLVRDALMTRQVRDPRGAVIIRAYSRALLLLGEDPQARGRLTAAGMEWKVLAPALEWLCTAGLAVRSEGRRSMWRASPAGLALARAVRTGARDVRWLRHVLAHPGLIRRAAAAAARPGSPAGIAAFVDGAPPPAGGDDGAGARAVTEDRVPPVPPRPGAAG